MIRRSSTGPIADGCPCVLWFAAPTRTPQSSNHSSLQFFSPVFHSGVELEVGVKLGKSRDVKRVDYVYPRVACLIYLRLWIHLHGLQAANSAIIHTVGVRFHKRFDLRMLSGCVCLRFADTIEITGRSNRPPIEAQERLPYDDGVIGRSHPRLAAW